MSYLVAAYTITAAALLGYAFWLRRKRRELLDRSNRSGGGPA
ncbi:MAG: heme exporter protein CcmD [Myxococcales bacterium]|nr:heme exporter protein CcmD [Myxococcales bacterium]